ncbi:GIDE domain-containing protein [Nocardioides jensenii]|uniref:GIDE domain-containing protein n=1 Tax=Nocardioides jensenii TaxID=1843 RepID=UPI00082B6FEC|nr:GIDE domain-containing protein [Nocardioides jensenii]
MWSYLAGATLALVVGAGAFWMSRETRGKYRAMLLTETSTTATLHELHQAATDAAGAGSYAEVVELDGTAKAGPRGLLVSEISKTECVWHKHRVTRRYKDVYRDKDGHRRTRTKEEVVTDSFTRDAFTLDDGEGTILVVPNAHGVTSARKSVSEFREAEAEGRSISFGGFQIGLGASDGDTIGFEYEEWVLLPETRVFVRGEARDRNGTLEVRDPKGREGLTISTESEDELLADHKKQALLYLLGSVTLVVLAIGLAVWAFVR